MRMSPPLRRAAASLFPVLVALAACSEQPTAPSAPAAPAALARVATKLSVAPTSWSAAGPGVVTLLNSGATGNPSMSYALVGYGSTFSTRTWSFSTIAASAGAITETFDYSGYHAYFQVRVFIQPFIIHNGNKSYLPGAGYGPANCCSSPSGGFHYSASTTFNVVAGDTYGYEFGGSNFDSDSRLLGTFTILYPEEPADATPPDVQSTVTGSLGNNGWYTSDVGVSWTVSDAESAISSTTGCSPSTLDADSNGATYTCSATSEGGSASASVTVKRDATAPTIAFSGNAGTYTVDQTVSIGCAASDAMSGLASSSCPGASGAAYTFGVGTQTLTASAEDNAGNDASASAQFTVQATSGSVCALVNAWVNQKGVANSMCQQLRNGAYGAFRNHVSAQSGKTVSAEHAAILIALSKNL